MTSMIGQSAGPYRIVRQLGAGGMGAVYAAEHTLIGKLAAIKVLLPQYSEDQEVVQRFFNEARAIAMIRHPSLVDVYDFGVLPSGSAFLAMELLDGESLAARLRREGRLSPSAAVEVIWQAAIGLAAAHDKDIIHRDLKPDNVFVTPAPEMPSGFRIKLLDFGIAKLNAASAGVVQTRVDALLGTPRYMSPELCRGAANASSAADVYSLGCMFFEMLCGQPPYLADNPIAIFTMHLTEPVPSARARNGAISPALDRLIAAMMAKNPEARPTMRAIISELEPQGSRPYSPRPSGRQAILPNPPVAGLDGPNTTLSGSAAEAQREIQATQQRGRGKVLWGLAAVGFVIAVGSSIYALGGGGQASPVAAPAPPSPRREEPAPAVEKPRQVKLVQLQFDSTPGGAQVFRVSDGEALGRTPLSFESNAGHGEVRFRLELAGHRPAEVTLDSRRDGAARVELHPLPAKKRSVARRAAADDTELNPFAQ